MPAGQSKISFNATNIVKTDNNYSSQTKREGIVKRKKSPVPDELMNQNKKSVPVSDLKKSDLTKTTKQQKSKNPKTIKLEFNQSKATVQASAAAANAAKNSRKRQIDIGNKFSKINSTRQSQTKTTLVSPVKSAHDDVGSSRSSFYVTPRQNSINISENENENINPNHGNFYESELDNFIKTQYPDFEDPSQYDFEHPLVLENFDLPQETFQPEQGLRHFKRLLDQEESAKNKLLEKSEVDLLRDIVKADERYQKLKRDDYQLIKEILIGQLKEISEQERVIKIALDKIRIRRDLDGKMDSIIVPKAEHPLESTHKDYKKEKPISVKQQEVDIFFKNVPSLEREIRILKHLGLKLEETLKKSSASKGVVTCSSKTCITTTFIPIQKVYYKHSIHICISRVLEMASKSLRGIAQEFKISHQTIDELKLERDFYIATDLNNFTLQRTNFDNLRINPELLMRRLRPITKDSRLRFNIIEQDPMFFNHFLAKICKISSTSFTTHESFIPRRHCIKANTEKENDKEKEKEKEKEREKEKPDVVVCDAGGDYVDFTYKKNDEEEIPILDLPKDIEKPIEKPISKIVHENGQQRKIKHRKTRTPLDEKKFVSSKNSFLKTILLGSLHLSIVLMVLTAIFYPDVICI